MKNKLYFIVLIIIVIFSGCLREDQQKVAIIEDTQQELKEDIMITEEETKTTTASITVETTDINEDENVTYIDIDGIIKKYKESIQISTKYTDVIANAFDIYLLTNHLEELKYVEEQKVVVDGVDLYLVSDLRFTSYQDYQKYIEETFTSNISDQYIKSSGFAEHDGRLYTIIDGAGTFYGYNKYEVIWIEENEDAAKVILRVPDLTMNVGEGYEFWEIDLVCDDLWRVDYWSILRVD